MAKRSFKGVAYWRVSNAPPEWATKAVEVLKPLEQVGDISVSLDVLPAGDEILVAIDDERHQLLINSGEGRGVVRPSPTAAGFTLCLLALRKAPGCIDVIDDAQNPVPSVPRQNYALFAQDWERVRSFAETLGLVANMRAADAMRRMLV